MTNGPAAAPSSRQHNSPAAKGIDAQDGVLGGGGGRGGYTPSGLPDGVSGINNNITWLNVRPACAWLNIPWNDNYK